MFKFSSSGTRHLVTYRVYFYPPLSLRCHLECPFTRRHCNHKTDLQIVILTRCYQIHATLQQKISKRIFILPPLFKSMYLFCITGSGRQAISLFVQHSPFPLINCFLTFTFFCVCWSFLGTQGELPQISLKETKELFAVLSPFCRVLRRNQRQHSADVTSSESRFSQSLSLENKTKKTSRHRSNMRTIFSKGKLEEALQIRHI